MGKGLRMGYCRQIVKGDDDNVIDSTNIGTRR